MLFDICPSRDDAQSHVFDGLICEFCGKNVKKEYDQLTAANNHAEAAVAVIDAIGTGHEKILIHTIASRVRRDGRIGIYDQAERDNLMRRFRHVLKNS